MDWDEEIAEDLTALSEEATAFEARIEAAYVSGAPLDPILQQLYEDATSDYQAIRDRRVARAAASSGAAAPG